METKQAQFQKVLSLQQFQKLDSTEAYSHSTLFRARLSSVEDNTPCKASTARSARSICHATCVVLLSVRSLVQTHIHDAAHGYIAVNTPPMSQRLLSIAEALG